MLAEQISLSQPPEDGISRVRFAPAGNLLVASSWDKVRLIVDFFLTLLHHLYRFSPLLSFSHIIIGNGA